MRLLITGGAGFIGSNLARMAATDPRIQSIAVIDDLSTGIQDNLAGLDLDCTFRSILDGPALADAMTGVQAVVHLAAVPSVPRSLVDPFASHEANATGTLRVLQAARESNVRKVVVASSSSVYGSNPTLPKNEKDWTRPLSPYAVSKLASEAYAGAYMSSYGLDTISFRFFNVFGPGQPAGHAYAAVIPKFIAAALNGDPVDIYGDGHQSRDFTFVDTVCSVLLQSTLNDVASPDPINLALGHRTTLLELIGALEELLGITVEQNFLPVRIGDVQHSQADARRLLQEFPGVSPVPLVEGLRRTVEWFRINDVALV